jgi:uncharacterized membrane protein
MSEIPQTPEESTGDDRLWALLSYLITPLVPIIILLMEDKKNRPFIKTHAVQALALGIVLVILNVILPFIPVVNFISQILPLATLLLTVFCAVKAYRGEYFNIPVITAFVKNQGWM